MVCIVFICISSAESCKESQTVKIKEEPMEVDIHSNQASVSPSQNISYSTSLRQEITENIQKIPEGRVLPERNLFSQDISVKMASELLFQLSGKNLEVFPLERNGIYLFISKYA